MDQLIFIRWRLERFLRLEFRHRTTIKLRKNFFTDKSLFSILLTKEIIEDKTYQRNKDKYENPRQCLYRITVIQQYDNNRSDDYSQINQI